MQLKDIRSWLILLGLVTCCPPVQAAPPWARLVPFRRGETVDSKPKQLLESDGPWLVFCCSFGGEGATEQAAALARELRSQYGLTAYLHQRKFDYTEPVIGLGVDKYGNPKKMRNARDMELDEIAVLVGDFQSPDEAAAQKTLDTIKHLHPQALDIKSRHGAPSAQRLVGLRTLYAKLSPNQDEREKGPMRRAFIVRNPLIPDEYFVRTGPDPFVLEMNRHVEYSLLDNPGRYTVRVASFSGESHFEGEQASPQRRGHMGFLGLPSRSTTSKLEIAADKAHRLTVALRKNGVDAYEFHDRGESIVTIGSFDSCGQPRPDGKTEINPAILKIMTTYGADRQPLPGYEAGLKPKSLAGIRFDVQPLPVEVPHRPIGASKSEHYRDDE